MKLKFKSEPVNLAGSAVSGCGTIHKSEVVPTLTQLSADLKFPVDLNDYVLGSTGKREYSGDIDLVLDPRWYNGSPKDFERILIDKYGKDNVSRNFSMVHLKYPISDYNEDYRDYKPRTGFVQVDFNFGDAEWERFYHYSAGAESEYKGGHRNLAMYAVCRNIPGFVSPLVDSYERPIEEVYWRFGPTGLSKVIRQSVLGSGTSGWQPKQVTSVVDGPFRNPEDIADILFPIESSVDDLKSLETIMDAVKRNYGMVDQERIWRRMAKAFMEWNVGRDFEYPSEISRYFNTEDK